MKKIEEMSRTANEIVTIIHSMTAEINRLRNIVYRYHIKHGESIQGGKVEFEDNLSFIVDWKGEDMKCEIVDEKEIGLTSNYNRIKQLIENLDK